MGQFGQPVKKRIVFYVPGFDPRPARAYRELYRSEGQKQARITGYALDVKARGDQNTYGWRAELTMQGQASYADILLLEWADIVRQNMRGSVLSSYLYLIKTAWIYLVSGALWRLAGLRKGPVVAAMWPVMHLLGQAIIALFVAWFVGILGALIHPAFGWVLSVIAFCGVLWAAKKADNRIFAHYLMQDFAFSARWGGANPPQLETRLKQFQDKLCDALTQDVDEVLLVGHSSGAYLGVSILADLLRSGRIPADGPALAFLSLGQVIPMVSFLPNATRLRRDLHDLSKAENITWVDVTAPGDGCAFALCDPVCVSGVAPKTGKSWPLVVSAAFSETLSKELWHSIKRRFFRVHFQYMCAFDQPRDYDYFQITAGPLSLSERYKNRDASPSRITQAASPHRTMSS